MRVWVRQSRFTDTWTARASSPELPVPVKQPANAEDFSVALTRDPQVIAGALDAFFIQRIHRWSSRDVQSQFVHGRVARCIGRSSSTCWRRDASHDVAGGRSGSRLRVGLPGRRPTLVRDVLRHRGSEAWRRNGAAQCGVRARTERGATSVVLARGDELLLGNPAAKARQIASVRVAREGRGGMRKRLASTSLGSRLAALGTEMRQVAHVATNAKSIVEGRKKRSELGSSHRDYYDAGSITKVYVRETRLQKPEQVILRELQPKLPAMRVLDVGVGAGRTCPTSERRRRIITDSISRRTWWRRASISRATS